MKGVESMKPVANKNRCRTNMTSRWMQALRSACNTQDTRFGFVSRFPDRLPEIGPLRASRWTDPCSPAPKADDYCTYRDMKTAAGRSIDRVNNKKARPLASAGLQRTERRI